MQWACTRASTATADAASFLALIIRARWEVAKFGVALTYVKQSPEGDALIGRLLAMLDEKSAQFATLPPHFVFHAVSKETVASASQYVFGEVVLFEAKTLVPHLLASLIYHFNSGFLRKELPADHPLWHSCFGQLLNNAEVCQQLSADVTLENTGEFKMTPMGVPVAIIGMQQSEREFRQVRERMAALETSIADVCLGVANIAQAIPHSELDVQWSVGAERANQWAAVLSQRLTDALKLALQQHLPRVELLAQAQGAAAAAAAGCARVCCCLLAVIAE